MANKRGRRTFTREFKARVARDAMRDVDTVNAVAARHGVDPSLVRDWRRLAEANMKNAFGSTPKAEANQDALIKDLHAKIGELTMERDFFLPSIRAMSHAERHARLEWNGPMSIAQQCRLLGISRRSAYTVPKRMPERDLTLMRRMDELHLSRPMYGARQMVFALRREGIRAGRNRVRRLMRIMGLVAVAPKPSTSVKAPSHKVFPGTTH